MGNLLLNPLLAWSTPPIAAGPGFMTQSVLALLVAALLVGLRCSGAVTGERERQTWEALLLTPLPVQHLIRGKLWGIIGASYPYLLSFAVPALALSVFGGWNPFFWTVVLLAVTWLSMAFVGAAGLYCSVRAKSSWRSLLGTVLIGYGGGFFLLVVALPLAGILWLMILLTMFIIDLLSRNQTALASWFVKTSDIYKFGTCLALVGLFLVMTWYFVADAQKYVADRERIRHWKEEPKRVSRRRRIVSDAKNHTALALKEEPANEAADQ
jgi:ABC-type transport system involved in multi-copper enzyme maturation permease subunit